jgi:hypothetical protein
MQHTALPGTDTTSRTGDGGYLFGREFALLHWERMQQNSVANLYKSGQLPGLGRTNATTRLVPLSD